MKAILKRILRSLGLLRLIRRLAYRRKYRNHIRNFRGLPHYKVAFQGVEAKFSVEDPFSATFFSVHFQNGIYEENGLKVLLAEVEADQTVVDVGANIGYFTCLAAKHCTRGRIYSFELGVENFKILERNIALNGFDNVVPEFAAVSDVSGKVMVKDSAVGNAVLKMVENRSESDLVEVKSFSLDDYCRRNEVTPDFIKIDVEGAEMKVLLGMQNILRRDVKLLIEIHEKDLLYFHSSKDEVLMFLQSFGFMLRTIENDVRKNILIFAFKPHKSEVF